MNIDVDVQVIVALAGDVGIEEICGVSVVTFHFHMTTSQSGQEMRGGAIRGNGDGTTRVGGRHDESLHLKQPRWTINNCNSNEEGQDMRQWSGERWRCWMGGGA